MHSGINSMAYPVPRLCYGCIVIESSMELIGADFRLGAVAGTVYLTQGPMAMGFHLDEALGIGSVFPNHITLPAVGGIAQHPRLLSMP